MIKNGLRESFSFQIFRRNNDPIDVSKLDKMIAQEEQLDLLSIFVHVIISIDLKIYAYEYHNFCVISDDKNKICIHVTVYHDADPT